MIGYFVSKRDVFRFLLLFEKMTTFIINCSFQIFNIICNIYDSTNLFKCVSLLKPKYEYLQNVFIHAFHPFLSQYDFTFLCSDLNYILKNDHNTF